MSCGCWGLDILSVQFIKDYWTLTVPCSYEHWWLFDIQYLILYCVQVKVFTPSRIGGKVFCLNVNHNNVWPQRNTTENVIRILTLMKHRSWCQTEKKLSFLYQTTYTYCHDTHVTNTLFSLRYRSSFPFCESTSDWCRTDLMPWKKWQKALKRH